MSEDLPTRLRAKADEWGVTSIAALLREAAERIEALEGPVLVGKSFEAGKGTMRGRKPAWRL